LYQDSDYKGRGKEFVSRHNTWNAQEIAKNASKILCAMGFYSFTALIVYAPVDISINPIFDQLLV
jgi:ribonuclease J